MYPSVPAQEDWYRFFNDDWEYELDAETTDLTEALDSMEVATATRTSSLGRHCTIIPFLVESSPCSVPPTKPCCGGVYVNMKKKDTPTCWNQTQTAVPTIPGSINRIVFRI